MTCQRCGLPDLHHGQGDGIGSCDCPRCYCCAAAPDDCTCSYVPDDPMVIEDLNADGDYLCNDLGCPTRQARIEAKAGSTP